MSQDPDPRETAEKTLYLIDGTAYIHRAYHAIRNLSNSRGFPTNAVFGFARMLIKLMEERRPQYAVICFDAKGPTFRHERYDAYKANRPPMPEDMAVQIPYIKKVTEGFRLPTVELAGYEADDLIGTLAEKAENAGFTVVIATGDKDFMQLVSERVSIWDPMKDRVVDVKRVREEFGLAPEQMIDAMGLAGDSADNIPGVPGIGMKTAAKLIGDYGTMDALYENLDRVAGKKQKENLAQYREQAFLSRDLVRILRSAPVGLSLEDFEVPAPDREALFSLFTELEFRQLQQQYKDREARRARDYRMILDGKELATLVETLAAAQAFAVDTETTSQDPMRAQLVGVSFAVRPHEAFYIPCGHRYDGAPAQLPAQTVLNAIRPLIEDPARPKIGQNIKYDWIVFQRCGLAPAGGIFDTMVASYLINPTKRAHSLDQIALDFLGVKTVTYQEVTGKGKDAKNFSEVSLDKASPYACEDADLTLQAKETLEPRLAEIGLTSLMASVEMPLIPVLVRMEMRGVRVDTDLLGRLSRSFEDQLDALEGSIHGLAGEAFNINSSQQLSRILFEKLKLPVQKKTKKKTGYSTDVDVLTALAQEHELPAMILRHRSLAKLKSTYTDALIGLVNPETGRIHTSFNQTVTATGRLSSSEPNLQNIPVRTEEGREIRRAFIPEQGWCLLSADYSQIELRVLAHCSDDSNLIEAFVDEQDIHARTASEVFDVEPDRVTPELRRQAKAINFGIIYGMSPFGLSRQLGISQKMAKTYIDHYFSRYPKVRAFLDATLEEARQTRSTGTLMGRIRLLPEIRSSNFALRQFAERTAINTPIQGTAADLLKVAMIRIDERLRRERRRSAMILTVHDELVLEVAPDERDDIGRLVTEEMEGVQELRVPLKVNVAYGQNWAEAH
ncbi:MAG: DNA polymerase I [Desulfobacterales bacterium]|jgi:DNA polymerase-1